MPLCTLTSQSAQASPNAAELPKQAAPEYNINASVANVVSMADSVNPSTAKQYPSFTGLSPYSRMTYSPKYNQTKTPAASNGENASLTEELIVNVRNAAMAIYQEMDMQAFPLPKKIPQEMVHILEMATDHPQREEEIRKWAPIYGRFDSKRKSEKPLSLHEVRLDRKQRYRKKTRSWMGFHFWLNSVVYNIENLYGNYSTYLLCAIYNTTVLYVSTYVQ